MDQKGGAWKMPIDVRVPFRQHRIGAALGRVGRWTLRVFVLGLALIGFLHVTRGTAVRHVRGVSSDGIPIAVDDLVAIRLGKVRQRAIQRVCLAAVAGDAGRVAAARIGSEPALTPRLQAAECFSALAVKGQDARGRPGSPSASTSRHT